MKVSGARSSTPFQAEVSDEAREASQELSSRSTPEFVNGAQFL
jgi:hypothetical protein